MSHHGETAGEDPGEAGERPTVRDVAAVAGVSFKTVARVINGEPGVRPVTAERVMAAVNQLGFRRNVIAANLAKGGSQDQIGLVIEDVANPFWATLARAIEDVVSARGLQVIVASSDYKEDRERRIIDSLVAKRLSGLLIVPIGRDHRYLASEMRLGTAIVFLDRPQGHLRADTVTFDDYGGARAAAQELLSRGHRRVAALMQMLDVHTMTERLRGFSDAFEDAHVKLEPSLVRHELRNAEDAGHAVAELLRSASPPTAFFCANNRMTVGAIRAISASHQHVDVIGFDDFELAGSLASPVTVMRTDVEQMGRLGAELLLRRMDGWTGEPQKVVLPVELVERGARALTPECTQAS